MLDLYTIDLETFYSQEYSLSRMTTEEYIRDSRFQTIGVGISKNGGKQVWVTGNMVGPALRKLRLDRCIVLGHHTAFDGAILNWIYGIRPKFLLDTLSMARPRHALSGGCSLKALARYYGIGEKGTEIINAKGKRLEDFSMAELAAYGVYCKQDVNLTYKLFRILGKGFPTSELRVIDMFLRCFTEPKIVLNRPLLETHLKGVLARKQAMLDDIEDHGGKEDIMSNPKFAILLEKHGAVVPMKISARTGKEAFAFAKTDEGLLALKEHSNEIIQTLVATRLGVKSTIEETRTQRFIAVSGRGPLPIMLNYYGAHTGRASGGEKLNLQNLPRGGALRKSMCAPPGYSMCAGDSSQIEARGVGWWAGQDDLTEAFDAGQDVYSLFATDLYGYEVTNCKATKIERHVGKTCILGLGYGMGWKRLMASLKTGFIPVELSATEAKRAVALYRRKYYKIPQLWKSVERALYAMIRGESGFVGPREIVRFDGNVVYLPNGMTLRYPGLCKEGDDVVYYARKKRKKLWGGAFVENVNQALARIVVFDQMLKIHPTYPLVLTVHDEGVFLIPDAELNEGKALITKEMRVPPPWARDLPIECEVEVGPNYGECK